MITACMLASVVYSLLNDFAKGIRFGAAQALPWTAAILSLLMLPISFFILLKLTKKLQEGYESCD